MTIFSLIIFNKERIFSILKSDKFKTSKYLFMLYKSKQLYILLY